MSDRSEPHARFGTRHALLWSAAAVVLPGVAHLRAGARRTGWTILGCFALLLAGVAALATGLLGGSRDLVRLALQPGWILAGGVAVAILGVLWVAVIVHSYVLLRPQGVGAVRRTAAVVLVGVLCLIIAAPAAATAQYAYIAHDRLNSIFSDGAPAPDVSPEEAAAVAGDFDEWPSDTRGPRTRCVDCSRRSPCSHTAWRPAGQDR
jgi:polyisoprenyl-teichoic acid--peptidoglycan teichoic acid transferase